LAATAAFYGKRRARIFRAAGAFVLYFLKAKTDAWAHVLIMLKQKMALAAQKGSFKKNLKSLPA
jgi:hypothetical protein